MTDFDEKDVEILQRFAHLFSYAVEAERDVLTNLYNRRYLEENFDYIMKKGCLMFLDLDGFKEVNDQYGHYAGDDILKEVGKRIKKCVGPDNVVIRYGGDEFVLLFPDILDSLILREYCDCIIKTLSKWKSWQYEIDISASIGISIFPYDATELSALIKKADTAMYQAKAKGKNDYQFFK